MTNTEILSTRPMGRVQIIAVAVAIALNALDGFDVLAITFAAPELARAWQTGPAALGAAISAGLVGMTLGSLVLAPAGDRIGRRPLVLGCVAVMGIGMMMTATAGSIFTLSLWRLLTGLGIGGMLAAINAIAAEFSNEKRRDLSVALMTVGYPVGGLVGGFSSATLVEQGWQAIFVAGGLLTLAFVPLIWFGMPESVAFLDRRGRPGDRDHAARLMRRMGHMPVESTAPPAPAAARLGALALFAPAHRRLTILLIASYFLHIVTFYFFSGWLPKLMSDLGHSTPDAIRTSGLMSMGGVVGGALLGWAAPRLGLGLLAPAVMVGTALSMAAFAQLSGLGALQAIATVVGACVFGGIVALYALLARGFPPELRVTGTGLAVGVGRGGAIIGPVLGGVLLEAGVSLALCITVVGLFSLAAAVVVRQAIALGAARRL